MKKDLIGKGYVANLDEYEDDGYAYNDLKKDLKRWKTHMKVLSEIYDNGDGSKDQIELKKDIETISARLEQMEDK